MEKIEIERRTIRAGFSKTAQKLKTLIEGSAKTYEINSCIKSMRSKYEYLIKLKEEIANKEDNWTEESYAQEIREQEEYDDMMLEMEAMIEEYLEDKRSKENRIQEEAESQNSFKNNYSLPKLQLQAFDLSPENYLQFWAQYRHIYENPDLRDGDKLQYLLMSLTEGSRARNMIESFPPGEQFMKAMDNLHERFGREELIVEVYTRKLLKLVAIPITDLVSLYDKLSSCLMALESLGKTIENCEFMLYPMVESCLPPDVLQGWERTRSRLVGMSSRSQLDLEEGKLDSTPLKSLMEYLAAEVRSVERVTMAKEPIYEVKRTTAVFHAEGKKICCIFCEKDHQSQLCFKAKKMSFSERQDVVKKKACFRCLKTGHSVKSCRIKVTCTQCGKGHYDIMCRGSTSSEKEVVPTELVRKDKALFVGIAGSVYLKTIKVRLYGVNGSRIVRAFFDDGSSYSYILKSVTESMKLKYVGSDLMTHGLFGGFETPATRHKLFQFTIEGLDGGEQYTVVARDQEVICQDLGRPSRTHDSHVFQELKRRNIYITDFGEDAPPIELLLGADVIGRLLTGKVEVLGNGLSAIESKVGWTIIGAPSVGFFNSSISIPDMWSLDSLGINEPLMPSSQEKEVADIILHFKNTVRKNSENRYEVQLPWKVGHPPIPNNLNVAHARLESVWKRLDREKLLGAYNEVFLEWEKAGIIEEVAEIEESSEGPIHYLPHRPVIKEERSTKIRPVFDASVKSPGSVSLNDCLCKGPNLINSIPPLIAQFREGRFGVVADIKKAFLNISLSREDRDVVRFLWKDVETGKLKTFRHCRVVFGVSSSPFLLNATVDHHLQQFIGGRLEDTVTRLRKSFYVDDCVTSFESKEDALRFVKEARLVMIDGQFELTKWASNLSEFNTNERQSVLGLMWDPVSDTVYCKGVKLENSGRPLTKRQLLAVVSRIYDVIGIACPAILIPKVLLQKAWKSKVSWDEPLSDEISAEFNQWKNTLGLLEECKVPRQLLRASIQEGEVSAHVFCDASLVAMGVCIFLRQVLGGEVFVQLLAAKSRIAPLQQTTIPRLELLAACLGVRLWSSFQNVYPRTLPVTYWCDSSIALCWIKKAETWNTFVGNRVKEIRSKSSGNDWRHVPGELNPADLPSRGCDFANLRESQWWLGPSWLAKGEEEWPQTELIYPAEAFVEIKKGVQADSVTDLTCHANRIAPYESLLARVSNYFSKYGKIIRMVAWMFRFIGNVRKQSVKKTGLLSEEEIKRGELAVWTLIQKEWPKEESINFGKKAPFCALEDGVLRIKTRLVQGTDENDFQTPVVLPDHTVVRALIHEVHVKNGHAGVQVTLSKLREFCWVVRGRKLVRSIVNKCVTCKRYKAKAVQVTPGSLPVERLQRVSVFQIVGLDAAGPLLLKEGKGWVILFTCAVYRCVHLELVTSMSTEVFSMALRRFLARRGRSKIIYSDQGTNFVGLSRALKELNWQEIEQKNSAFRIDWRHNPPAAPWWGGWWERLVGVLKESIRKVLGSAFLSYQEMVTVLCEAEAVMNSRPLTYVSDDPNELRPITPAHFLQDLPGSDHPDLDMIDKISPVKRLRYVQEVRERLKERFKLEYLGELIRTVNVKGAEWQLVPGDIVFVGSDGTKRTNWPLARVMELYKGRDGVARVAHLKTARGEKMIRPVQRLYPLELRDTASAELLDVLATETSQVRDSNLIGPKEATEASPNNNLLPNTGNEVGSSVTRCGRKIKAPERLNL